MTRDPLTELSLSTYSFTVGHYVPRGDVADHFDLTAPYQRGSVWTVEQRQNLVRSLIVGIPVGVITYASLGSTLRSGGPREKLYRVIDGKQRIETVRAFVRCEFLVPAWWWQEEDLHDPTCRERDEADGINYAALSKRGKMRFDMGKLPANEYNSTTEYVRVAPGKGTQGSRDQWIARSRTEEEMLAAEAIVYGLINGAGTPQTDADMARARSVRG